MALILPNIFNKNNSHGMKSVKYYTAALYILAELVFCWTMATDPPENEYLLYILSIMQLIVFSEVYA